VFDSTIQHDEARRAFLALASTFVPSPDGLATGIRVRPSTRIRTSSRELTKKRTNAWTNLEDADHLLWDRRDRSLSRPWLG
jgi:hypothetical protein